MGRTTTAIRSIADRPPDCSCRCGASLQPFPLPEPEIDRPHAAPVERVFLPADFPRLGSRGLHRLPDRGNPQSAHPESGIPSRYRGHSAFTARLLPALDRRRSSARGHGNADNPASGPRSGRTPAGNGHRPPDGSLDLVRLDPLFPDYHLPGNFDLREVARKGSRPAGIGACGGSGLPGDGDPYTSSDRW